ncbi:MAG: hypothetical protein KKF65_05905 [Nanoarchaeota archaeon]|nr:hypothetical protein [Nanoarchaeota archaeon]
MKVYCINEQILQREPEPTQEFMKNLLQNIDDAVSEDVIVKHNPCRFKADNTHILDNAYFIRRNKGLINPMIALVYTGECSENIKVWSYDDKIDTAINSTIASSESKVDFEKHYLRQRFLRKRI